MNTSSIIADLTKTSAETSAGRIDHLDWQRITKELGEEGSALLPHILSPRECRSVAALYPDDPLYRSRVVMGRHGFGRGEYKYFKYPLPALIQSLRAAIYPRLVPIANSWNQAMGVDARYPEQHIHFVRRCHEAGQLRPTPLLLQYGEGDYNCLHQDLYGEHVFPIQVSHFVVRTGKRFYGWRICVNGATPAYAVAARGSPTGAR